ncbi:MAG: glycoside hydrolase family 127 protein [Planctomycetaceae bacterium]|nr:glycoside hydrolase family 127 protein [Planctomycetaceae bacterium]
MKNYITFLFVFALSFSVSLFAQYPKEETIKPYPKPITEKKLVQRFDVTTTGWKALHDSRLTLTDRTIQIESSGHDPYISLPNIQNPVGGAFEFRIRMKNNTKPNAELFWGTAQRPGSHPDFSTQFGFLPDNNWYSYSVFFETPEPLTQLRFDPGTSEGVTEIDWIELYHVTRDETERKPISWFNPNWSANVEQWKTISSENKNIRIRFDEKGTGAEIFENENLIGEIYPLGYLNPELPLGGVTGVPFYRDEKESVDQIPKLLSLKFHQATTKTIEFTVALPDSSNPIGTLRFELVNDEINFVSKSTTPFFSPVFRPKGIMKQAVLNGIEYLEQGEHSSSTADIETSEHLRFAPKSLDITWSFMAVVTEKSGFGLLWDNPETQAVFAVPDFIFGDSKSHYLGLYGADFSGTLKILKNENNSETQIPDRLTALDTLILWAVQKHGLPDLPKRFRNDEAQRLLNLQAYENSAITDSQNGWRHAVIPGAPQMFPPSFGVDYVTAIWQLTGKLTPTPHLNHGGAHLRNPAAFLLSGKAEQFRDFCRSEGKGLCRQQQADGAFLYNGKYLKGHWENTASGHCGNMLFRLLYDYRVTGDRELLDAAIKGLEFANKYTVPRGAQVWELSLHTPDIMGSSRMCLSNIWAFEATGEKKYLNAARRWAITGLPFVYLWQKDSIKKHADGATKIIMEYATTPVFGATNFRAPNWIGLPVQWCGLDYGEALFMLAKHDQTLDWQKIAEAILIVAEQMQYPEGQSIGLLPDSFNLEYQQRNIADINPTVLVMQRRYLQGQLESIDIALSKDSKFRIVSPFRTTIETDSNGKNVAVIEAVAGITYQIIINGNTIKTVTSQGTDRIGLDTL